MTTSKNRTLRVARAAHNLVTAFKIGAGARFKTKTREEAEDAATVAVSNLHNAGEPESARALLALLRVDSSAGGGGVLQLGCTLKKGKGKSRAGRATVRR